MLAGKRSPETLEGMESEPFDATSILPERPTLDALREAAADCAAAGLIAELRTAA